MSDVIGRIDAGDETEFVCLLTEATARIGASASYFMSFVREDETFASYRILLACDPLWGLAYDHAGCHASDPWLHHAMCHSEPRRSSEIACADAREQAVVDLAEKFGFRSAVVVPAPLRGGVSRLGVLVLGSAEPGYFEGAGYGPFKVLARALAMELHERCIALIRSESLTAAQSPIRNWISFGTTRRAMLQDDCAIAGNFDKCGGQALPPTELKLGSPNRKVSTWRSI